MPRLDDAEAVVVDGAALRDALDGRTQRWLARRVGISPERVRDFVHGRCPRTRRDTYERMRLALPALPPAPNGHGNGKEVAHARPSDDGPESKPAANG